MAVGGGCSSEGLANWEAVAPAWRRHREHLFAVSRPVSEWLLAAAAVGPDDTVLELAAGTGETSLLAAERAGRVICTDLAPAMVDAAREAAAASGAGNVEFRVMDAQRLALDDASVDAALCRYGLMLMPDPGAAVAEVRRVLRPGGRFAYAVWGAPERNSWITRIGAGLRARGIAPAADPYEPAADPYEPGGIFSLATPERNRALLAGAGFETVRIEELAAPLRFGSFDEFWSIQSELAGQLARTLAELPADEAAALRAAIEEATAAQRDADGRVEFSTLTLAVSSA